VTDQVFFWAEYAEDAQIHGGVEVVERASVVRWNDWCAVLGLVDVDFFRLPEGWS
jgi:hypothetical protein